jgi:hypothetical protein
VPASSANLGPGFDCMAAALALHIELEVIETGEFAVDTDLPLPKGRENLCVQAFERLHPADGFTFRIRSDVPLLGGLGSCAQTPQGRPRAPRGRSAAPTCSRSHPSSRVIPTTSPPLCSVAS